MNEILNGIPSVESKDEENRPCSKLNCPIDARKFKKCMFENPSTCPAYSPNFTNKEIGRLLIDIGEFILLSDLESRNNGKD